jgi:ribosome-associated translation inhibitor RaiA
MNRVFHEGQQVYVSEQIRAHIDPALDSSEKYLESGQEAVVVSYNVKGTEENSTDDFVNIKVTNGSQSGLSFWVPSQEFVKLHQR